MGNRTGKTGILKLFFMFALTSLVLWMLYGIAMSVRIALSASSSADVFGGIAGGFIIGMIAALINGVVAAGYVVARGFLKDDRSFTVPEKNAHHYAVAIGMNVIIFAAQYSIFTHAVPLFGN